jgi:hypothetical protein
MTEIIDTFSDIDELSPSAIAAATFRRLGGDEADDSPFSYAALEYFKVVARKRLAGRFNPLHKEDDLEDAQGVLFNGVLQARYPVLVGNANKNAVRETRYKRLELMTDEEIDWIADRFSQKIESETKHRDRLLEFKTQRLRHAAEQTL